MTTIAEARPAGRYAIHDIAVAAVTQLTPSMRRITFTGDALATLDAPLPAQWLKVAIPDPTRRLPENRAYTIRRLDADARELDIDFVLHGDAGPISAWAAGLGVGDPAQIGGLRGGYRIDPDAAWQLLTGDETALPAISGILEALEDDGRPVRAVIEVPSRDDIQQLRRPTAAQIEWLARDEEGAGYGALLVRHVGELNLAPGAGQVFVAGEAKAVRAIRKDIAARAPQTAIAAAGYWLFGSADHRDPE